LTNPELSDRIFACKRPVAVLVGGIKTAAQVGFLELLFLTSPIEEYTSLATNFFELAIGGK
jgi:hypothetical protein